MYPRQSVARMSGIFTPAEVLKRAPTGDRAPPGAVKEGFSSGVSARIMQHKEYGDLGIRSHVNPLPFRRPGHVLS